MTGPEIRPGELGVDDLAVADRIACQVAVLTRIVQRRYARSADFGPAICHALSHLARGAPQRAGSLAEALCTDPSTVSRQVAALLRRGLIERCADPSDGRASLLAVTPAGYAALEHSCRPKVEIIADTLAGWPIEDRREFVSLLAELISAYQRQTR
ncbi:MarR family winged helix-turn-helix transcriptional regulator [Pseudonocardia ailaonensis]|uniref:MarR family winged helix-turn-helix transcriptional regulator n=1 Tax=Pseudonocardia ailaonensis TaxID=367279 RepID=UPI0031E0378D